MKNIAIITSVSKKSADIIATALNTRSYGECKAKVFQPFDDVVPSFRGFDYVLSIGCSKSTDHKPGRKLNKRQAVLACVDKPTAFDIFKKAGVCTVNYCQRKADVPKGWDTVVVREKVDGRKAEGLHYVNQCDGEPLIDGVLYSEYFEHKDEYRIMVFAGKIVGRYHKHEIDGDWFFNLRPARGFEKMDDHVLRAAKALGIDYAGFDVVAKTKNDFKILEANSGATITDEAETAIVEYFMNAE